MKLSRAQEIMAIYEAIEEGDPDISTERLLEMTRHAAKCQRIDEVTTALQLTQSPTTTARDAEDKP